MQKYQFIRKLGHGIFGEVDEVQRTSDMMNFVMKKIRIDIFSHEKVRNAEEESKLVLSCQHPYIVKYLEMFWEMQTMQIVMELCGTNLNDYISIHHPNGAPEELVLKWTFQLGLALEYIHCKNIIHKDIREQNILLNDHVECKLSDFVLLRKENTPSSNLHEGYTYQSPELLSETGTYSFKSDMWALGCVVHFMCTRQHPFTRNILNFCQQILNKSCPTRIDEESYSGELQILTDQMICYDMSLRLSADQLLSSDCFKTGKYNEWDVKIPQTQLLRLFQKRDGNQHQMKVVTQESRKERLSDESTKLDDVMMNDRNGNQNQMKIDTQEIRKDSRSTRNFSVRFSDESTKNEDVMIAGLNEENVKFTYSDEMRQKSETKLFTQWSLKGILCSPSGEFKLDWSTFKETAKWLDGWKKMLNGQGDWRGLWSFLRLPQECNEVLLWVDVSRTANELVIRAVFAEEDVTLNRPEKITIKCDITVHCFTKGGMLIEESKKSQIRDISSSKCELMRVSTIDWKSFDMSRLPTVTIHLQEIFS